MKQKNGNKSTQQFARLSPNKRVSVEKDRPPIKPLRHAKDKQDDLLPSPLTRSGKSGSGKTGSGKTGNVKGGAAIAMTGIPEGAVHAEHVMVSKKVIEDIHAGIANLEAAFGALANALRVLE
ncbi:MAG: hypothetical protein ABIW76_04745 [Fibrobacteria bacterium]